MLYKIAKNFTTGIKILSWFSWCIILLIPFLFIYITRLGIPRFLQFFWKGTAFIIRMKVKVEGRLSQKKLMLCIANHSSYFDIIAFGSAFKLTFIAKKEIRKWPIFGTLTKMAGMVFIDRRSSKATTEINKIQNSLYKKRTPIVIFPEGTTNNGNEIKPFKSALFSAFENQMEAALIDKDKKKLAIQPMVIIYTNNKNKKLNAKEREQYAWYIYPDNSEPSLAVHLWRTLNKGSFTVKIKVFPPIEAALFQNRKDLTKYCQTVIEREFNKLLEK